MDATSNTDSETEPTSNSEATKEFRPLHPGVREHYIRAVLFYQTGRQTPEVKNQFRSLMAAAYSCRAMAELIFEVADNQEMSVSRTEVKLLFEEKVRYFSLVEKLRIHDFHRHGLQPPRPGANVMKGNGPIRLTASKGEVLFIQTPEGPKFSCTGNSKVTQQRPLFELNGAFYDEKSSTHVPLPQIIAHYLIDIPSAIAECEKLYIQPQSMFLSDVDDFLEGSRSESAIAEPSSADENTA